MWFRPPAWLPYPLPRHPPPPQPGLRSPFQHPPPPLPPNLPKALNLCQEVEDIISKGALERVDNPGPGFYSRLFLVEKASGGWRPVIDLSPLNEFVRQTPFKMETASSVLLSVKEGDFLASVDLKGNPLQDTDTEPPPVLGRVPIGMGSPPPRPISIGDMVAGRGLAAHQPSRNESPVPSPSGIQGPSHGPPSDSDVRQPDSGCLCQQAGGHDLRLLLLVDRETSPMVGVQQSPAGSEVLARAVQCPGRPPQPPEPGSWGRVVTPSTGSKESPTHVGVPHAGLVRDSPECEAAPVLLSDPGSSSPLRGRLPVTPGTTSTPTRSLPFIWSRVSRLGS